MWSAAARRRFRSAVEPAQSKREPHYRRPDVTRFHLNSRSSSTLLVLGRAGRRPGRRGTPREPLRRQLVPTEPFDQLPKRFPMVIDMSTGFHFRREGKGIYSRGTNGRDSWFKNDFDATFVEKILTHAHHACVLDAAEVNPRRAWAGLYEMTPIITRSLAPAECKRSLFRERFQWARCHAFACVGPITADLILQGHSDLIDAFSTRCRAIQRR